MPARVEQVQHASCGVVTAAHPGVSNTKLQHDASTPASSSALVKHSQEARDRQTLSSSSICTCCESAIVVVAKAWCCCCELLRKYVRHAEGEMMISSSMPAHAHTHRLPTKATCTQERF